MTREQWENFEDLHVCCVEAGRQLKERYYAIRGSEFAQFSLPGIKKDWDDGDDYLLAALALANAAECLNMIICRHCPFYPPEEGVN